MLLIPASASAGLVAAALGGTGTHGHQTLNPNPGALSTGLLAAAVGVAEQPVHAGDQHQPRVKFHTLTLVLPLQGSLPPQWAALSSLSTLALNTNNLTRTLPAAYATMESLERAYLYSNFFTGAQTLGARNLGGVLSLACKPAHGRRPWPALCAISWSNACASPRHSRFGPQSWSWSRALACACAGTLPPEYANLTGLVDLDVHDNLLTGTLPAAYFTATAFTNNTFVEARCPPVHGGLCVMGWLPAVRFLAERPSTT